MNAVWIILAVLLLVLAPLALGLYLAGFVMSVRRQTWDEARQWVADRCDLSRFEAMEKDEWTVTGQGGYKLYACRLFSPSHRGRFVVLTHGYTDNHFGMLKYAGVFADMGFDLVLWDQRGHGVNEKTVCTYTARERDDLTAVIASVRERYGAEVRVLGLHGESLGAATTAACLRDNPTVDFAVCDCAFADIGTVLGDVLRARRLPVFLVGLTSACAKVRDGLSFRDMRPIDRLAGVRVPTLFIHGAGDTFVLPEHSRRLHEALEGSRLLVVPGAGHAESVFRDPEGYAAAVRALVADALPQEGL